MMRTTSATPTMPARIPSLIESCPSDGPMVRSSMMVSGAGRAPAFSTSAKSCASCSGLAPSSIWPCWPIWPLITGGCPCTRRADGALFDDGERRRQGARLQHQRQVLRLLQRLGAELDLGVLADLALDHRRLPPHSAVEDDRHVVLHVPAGRALEDAPAAARQREVHHRLVGERIARGPGVLQLLARDDGAILHRVE